MNSVNLIGNLSKDVDLRYTTTGKAVANFSIAVKDTYKDSAHFFNVVVWGKQAENCATYLSKGKKVGITGRLEQSSWENDQGKKQYKVEIVAEQLMFLTPKSDGNQQDEWGDMDKEVSLNDIDIVDGDESDIPF